MLLSFSTDDPLHTRLCDDDGTPVYYVRTDRTPSALRSTTTSIWRVNEGCDFTCTEQEKLLAQVVWGGLGRRDTVRSALFGAGDKVRVKDLLFADNAFGKSKLFIGADEEVYKWKWCENRGLQLIHVESDTVKALYLPSSEGSETAAMLKIHDSCPVDADVVVLTFIIVEKKRRDALADAMEAPASRSLDALAEAGIESGAM